MEEFGLYFGAVPDPRASNARHDLLELIFVALAAMLCGAEDCTDIAEFVRAKLAVLRRVVGLKHGVPSHDPFSRVFRLLDPERFEAAFARASLRRSPARWGGWWRLTARRCGAPMSVAARRPRCILSPLHLSTSGRRRRGW